MKRIVRICLVIFLLGGSGMAQDASGIKPANIRGADLGLMHNHDPAVEQAHLDLLPGYAVNLFAAEPMLANPIHMVWDSRGRLWVACSWAYPQLKPGEVANDKVIILEDADGDGRADKSTVFADGLYMPTGIALRQDGCYVAQTPDVYFLPDRDGDGVAEARELVLTGFGIEDSHHSISAWRRGPGGWIYFQEGIFLHTQVETPYGVVRNYHGGVYQFNPRTEALRVFAKIGVGNPWGHVFDRWGQSFFVDNPRISYLTPSTGNSGEKVRLTHLIKTEKQCGGDLASGRHLPGELRGQLLTCRFKSRSIVRYEFSEDGAGFSARVLPPLLSSRHPNFRPVDCKMGPDGAVYVADWYNPIINHAQHDFRDPRRDHEHGRIWRITATGRPLVARPVLAGAAVPDLLEQLKSPEAWTRHQARYELGERDPDVVAAALAAWVDGLSPNDPEHDHHLVEAMWACQNVERPSEAILARVLAAKDGRARAAGARVIRYWHEGLSDPVGLVARAAADPHPRVRLEGVLSAGFLSEAEAFPAALAVLDFEPDVCVDVALPQTVKALEPLWMPAMAAGKLRFAKPEHRAFAERYGGIGFDKRLAAFLRDTQPGAEEIAQVREQFVQAAREPMLRMTVRALASPKGLPSREASLALLEAMREAGRRPNRAKTSSLAGLRPLLGHADEAIAAGAAGVLGAWQVRAASGELVALLRDAARGIPVRQAAAQALVDLGQPADIQALEKLMREGDPASRSLAVIALVRVQPDVAAEAAGALLAAEPGGADPVALVQAFLQRKKGDVLLARALEGGAVHPEAVTRVAAFHRRTGQLPGRLAKIFHEEPPAALGKRLLRENRADLVADVEKLGDPARGERVYRRKELACTLCHGIGPVGPSIGPNLVAVGAAAPTAYLVESVLQPNAAIAEHYENMMFTLVDGSVRTGVVTFKSSREVVIRDAAQGGREVRLPSEDIQTTTVLPSLMPAGLVDALPERQDFLDLAKFLSELGRPGPYANDERPVIRKWGLAERRDAAAWLSATSLVSGELPASDLLPGEQVYARGFVQVQLAGPVRLRLNDARGLRLWLDGEEIEDPDKPIVLGVGRRCFTFGINRGQRGEVGLQVELVPAAGSAARFVPEGGM